MPGHCQLCGSKRCDVLAAERILGSAVPSSAIQTENKTPTCQIDVAAVNFERYGNKAPLPWERIWVPVNDLTHATFGPLGINTKILRRLSGLVVGNEELEKDLESRKIRIEETKKYRYCKAHFIDEKPWSELPEYRALERRLMRKYQASTLLEKWRVRRRVKGRYRAIDRIWEEVRLNRRLPPTEEMVPKGTREWGGIMVHISRDGQFLLGDGFHRFSICSLLEIEQIPAMVGLVDENALDVFYSRSERGVHD